ncbi:epididymal-specific lipocalin-12 [Moschus berezovskii]|uniref:epididymal-specific lipocalin-12 n=1 Tax=Moschus berezovskii TaxID=68408 RepID=UPI00244395E5|nr:epididymal-specific lipocalin-12 [Moschus berezovskii]
MGPWLALCVLLYLPRALQGQNPHTRVAPSSVLQSFEDSKFQGEWFVLGLAGNTHTVADRSLLSPFTAKFTVNKNNHVEVAYAMIRGQRCVTWSYELISQSQPGTFSVAHSGEPGADPEEIQVYDTDYASFALLLSRKQSDLQRILRVSLLCRIWAIQTQLLDKFICLVRAQGLSDDNIVFPDLTGYLLPPRSRPPTWVPLPKVTPSHPGHPLPSQHEINALCWDLGVRVTMPLGQVGRHLGGGHPRSTHAQPLHKGRAHEGKARRT